MKTYLGLCVDGPEDGKVIASPTSLLHFNKVITPLTRRDQADPAEMLPVEVYAYQHKSIYFPEGEIGFWCLDPYMSQHDLILTLVQNYKGGNKTS